MYSLRSLVSARAVSRAAVASPALARRALQTSAIRAAGKESAQGNPKRAEEAEAAKQEELAAQKQGRNQWRDELASDSESAVKADQHDKSISELQQESAAKAEQEKK